MLLWETLLAPTESTDGIPFPAQVQQDTSYRFIIWVRSVQQINWELPSQCPGALCISTLLPEMEISNAGSHLRNCTDNALLNHSPASWNSFHARKQKGGGQDQEHLSTPALPSLPTLGFLNTLCFPVFLWSSCSNLCSTLLGCVPSGNEWEHVSN